MNTNAFSIFGLISGLCGNVGQLEEFWAHNFSSHFKDWFKELDQI